MKIRNIYGAAPFLLFAVALVGGIAWLIGPFERYAPRPVISTPRIPRAKPPEPPPDRSMPPAQFAAEAARLRAQLEVAEADAHKQRIGLETSRADLEEARRRVDALRAELTDLEAKRAALPPQPVSPVQREIDTLHTVVRQREEEVDRLGADLQRARASVNPQGKGPDLARAVAPVKKLPQLVELFENRILPVTQRNFHYPFFSLNPVFVVKRVREGETIAEAREPVSQFTKFLKKIKPKKEYLICLLNPDSFDAFYAVREMTANLGIETGWEPVDTRSGKITLISVKMGLATDKNAVRLPDIVK